MNKKYFDNVNMLHVMYVEITGKNLRTVGLETFNLTKIKVISNGCMFEINDRIMAVEILHWNKAHSRPSDGSMEG
jgi:hypothetical protein